MRSSFNHLLVALTALDIVYVITGIVDYSIVKVSSKVCVLPLGWTMSHSARNGNPR